MSTTQTSSLYFTRRPHLTSRLLLMSVTSNKVRWMKNSWLCWFLLEWQYLILYTQIISCLTWICWLLSIIVFPWIVIIEEEGKSKLNQAQTVNSFLLLLPVNFYTSFKYQAWLPLHGNYGLEPVWLPLRSNAYLH